MTDTLSNQQDLTSLLTAGWEPLEGGEFIDLVGPVFVRRADNAVRCAFVAEDKHANRRGVMHGGMLAAFADHALAVVARDALGNNPVATVQLGLQMVAPVNPGDFVEADCEVVRLTRSLAFMRGILRVGERTVAAVDGVWKILTPRAS